MTINEENQHLTVHKPTIITVKNLLKEKLQIPDYQRPYKWSTKNVNQLIDDILLHQNKSEYRLGTLVIHADGNSSDKGFNIVDGQQRAITLALIAHAIQKLYGGDLNGTEFSDIAIHLLDLKLTNDISKENIRNNYRQIEHRIAEFDKKSITFFWEKCTVVKVVLSDISEAFQFFDSQNARGKDLEPHDLLKAFHLRAMSNHLTEDRCVQVVEQWESLESKTLSKLFSVYLFRIRQWSKGYPARYFSKNHIDVFKGINLNNGVSYPFEKIFHITHVCIEDYNESRHRKIDQQTLSFPFHIDGVIINGERFFEMVNHYYKMVNILESTQPYQVNDTSNILQLIHNYKGCHRTGDKYVRNLFYCGLLYYIDKFGEEELSKAIHKIFIWAYSLRLKLENVGIASVDNYALNKGYSQLQLFEVIRDSTQPCQVVNLQLDRLSSNKSTKTEAIIEKFKELTYYEQSK